MEKIVCVLCPMGCKIKYNAVDGKIVAVEGNRCPKGLSYLEEELKEPKRIVPTSVKVVNGELPLASVKTSKPIPKRLIPKFMELVKQVQIEAPVKVGDVIMKNVLDTGADVVATRSVRRIESA
jgi:CxxC motif-containing protein